MKMISNIELYNRYRAICNFVSNLHPWIDSFDYESTDVLSINRFGHECMYIFEELYCDFYEFTHLYYMESDSEERMINYRNLISLIEKFESFMLIYKLSE